MAAPLLQAQIDIGAPVAKVWTLAFSNMSINAMMGGVPSCERGLVDGMNATTLSRIKAAAES